jgi:MYXO-CTERM domain-containing protein
MRSEAAAALLVLAGLTASSASFAFCRTTTCQNCSAAPGECITEGVPVYWPVSCISYDLQQDASPKWVDLDLATATAGRAFDAWSHVTCPASGAPPSLAFKDLGPVACNRHEYNDEQHSVGGNANIIMFRDSDWDAAGLSDSGSTLALTTLTFNLQSGEIYDADIEINGEKPISAADVIPPDAYDLQSILTHEIGHFLGLAHSQVPCSQSDCPTMNALYSRGSQDFRSLEPDDVAGICAVYPTDRQSTPSNCRPSHGFSDDCGEPKASKKRCSVAAPGASDRSSGAFLLAAVVGLLARARRRSGRPL